MPAMPLVVVIKRVFGSVGLATIFDTARPVNTSLFEASLLYGPLSTAVVSACVILYSPTPMKHPLPHRLASPVPTQTVVGSDGEIVTLPMASDWALSIIGIQLAP